jgi:hypothetical protein
MQGKPTRNTRWPRTSAAVAPVTDIGSDVADREYREYTARLWDLDTRDLVAATVSGLDVVELNTQRLGHERDQLGRSIRAAKAAAFVVLNRLAPADLADALTPGSTATLRLVSPE